MKKIALLATSALLLASCAIPAIESDTREPEPSVATETQPTTAPSAAPVPASIEPIDEHSARLNGSAFGDAWPLTIPTGIVRCENGAWVVFETDDGTVYAVNGTAQSNLPDMPVIDEIWAPNPDIEGLKIDISPVINAGLDLCG